VSKNYKKSSLNKESDFFESQFDDLRKKYYHKFVVIKEEKVLGAYDTFQLALDKTSEKYEIGTFFIQQVTDKKEDLYQVYFSRVS